MRAGDGPGEFDRECLQRHGSHDGEDARRRVQREQGGRSRIDRDLAAQLGPSGIRVNAILPGVFPSEATAHYSENYKRKIIDARIPLGRIGDPEDIAAVVVFLASDASGYLTGVSLPVDGGVLVN